MARYKVPQKIELQDKLVGPLTFLQFGYLLLGSIVSFGIFKTGNWVMIILVAIPIVLLSLALAFVKVQNQSFGSFIFNLIVFIFNPKTRVWHHGQTSIPTIIKSGVNQQKIKKINPKKLDRKTINQISQQLDQS